MNTHPHHPFHIHFVTGNAAKYEALQRIMGDIEGLPHHFLRTALDLPEIQSRELEVVAHHKARAAFSRLQAPVLVEDVALCFGGLGMLPGPFIKHFEKAIGVEGLTALVRKLDIYEAKAGICYAFCHKGEVKKFTHWVKGSIAKEPRGTYGFGWDSIFVPAGQLLTYGEMRPSLKAQLGLRQQPLTALKAHLATQMRCTCC